MKVRALLVIAMLAFAAVLLFGVASAAPRAATAPAVAAPAALQPRVYFPIVGFNLPIPAGRPAGVIDYVITDRAHITGTIIYPQTPPAGGNHWPIWLNCGFYDTPVHNEEGVHSLEHGAVWITYAPNLPANQINLLHQIIRGEVHTIASPYIGLPAPIVATAWDHQLYLSSATDPRLMQFIYYFRNGPDSGEPNGPCTGGDGTPLP